MTNQSPIQTRAPSELDKFLQQKFTEEIVQQANRLDELAKQLFTLELAVPSVYITVLQLVQGEKVVLGLNAYLIAAFGCWFLALLLTFFTLFPNNRYNVKRNLIRRESVSHPDEGISIEEFFQKSARDKYWELVAGSVCFFLGLACAGLSIFIR
ncbi:hypothetical protein [Beggiatoa leptomitoformis]|uniref:Uncharacterized protein n=1 Tax=Beggiatoa leptomitoformis TaxID=288004 RepID=A0A2N9YCN7_9GAMM|nr:hypothetical protein [Beggiatoa leptomitoformis]ALG66484.1 hypothetical protein AL038_00450 [Beggiatoa leptomitoformis]AUI68225.1 hypothetical protein BLE401_05595 [Beggiatoa leptomitoformis]